MDGLAAPRRAFTSWLRDLPPDGWDERVKAAVARIHRLYAAAVDLAVDIEVPLDSAAAAADGLDRLADEVEPRAVRTDALMAELHDVARSLDVPTPSIAREAAVAAVVWRAADKVEAPVRIVLTSGLDYVVGAGDPEGVLHTDDD